MSLARGDRQGLLTEDDAAPAGVERAEGASAFVLICDHAGNQLPARLRGLGLGEALLASHIAWDIGVLGLARRLSERLDAPLIYQRYSRLVIDCNRPPRSPYSIPVWSDGTRVAANEALSESDCTMRLEEIFMPYHTAIESILDARARLERRTILLSMHSFTPRLAASTEARPWHVAVLFNRGEEFALSLVDALREERDLHIGVNEPYAVEDASDYAIPVHGEGRELQHALLEVRQDLIATEQHQAAWAARLERVLLRALDSVGETRSRAPLPPLSSPGGS